MLRLVTQTGSLPYRRLETCLVDVPNQNSQVSPVLLAIRLPNRYPIPMRVQELNHVAIHVRDVEASTRFYSEVLRLEAIPRPAFTFPGAWFRLGAIQELHIIGERTEPVQSNNRGNHFALRVDNLDEWEAHLAKVKADFRPRKMRPDGAWQVFLRDPDGHVVELFTGP